MKKALTLGSRCLESILLLFLSLFIKRRSDYVAFGSWGGSRFADNSRYLAEYIHKEFPNIHIVWIGDEKIRDEVIRGISGVYFAVKGTFTANIKLLKCKFMFFSQMHNSDISQHNVFRGAVMCYLHHGMPIKKWGQDGLTQSVGTTNKLSRIIHGINGENVKYNYFVTSSPLHDITNCSGLAYKGCTAEKNIHSGTPRNDMYFCVESESIQEMKNKYSSLLGFDATKKVIIYLPTYRRTSTDVFSFSRLSLEQQREVKTILEAHNAVIIEKSHLAEKNSFDGGSDELVICAPSDMNVQEMMLFSDILISDYSGAYLDFILLDRPVIHYAYDYDYYKNIDSGLYYEIEDFSAGPIVYDFDNLLIELSNALKGYDEYRKKRKYVKEKYMTYETGEASKKILASVIGEVS